jgi:hypothetical protein
MEKQEMSITKKTTLWSVTGACWIDDEKDVDSLVVTLRESDEDYAVVCTGHKGFGSEKIITALRAATAALIRANGGDISAVGAAELDTLYTGSQRAN